MSGRLLQTVLAALSDRIWVVSELFVRTTRDQLILLQPMQCFADRTPTHPVDFREGKLRQCSARRETPGHDVCANLIVDGGGAVAFPFNPYFLQPPFRPPPAGCLKMDSPYYSYRYYALRVSTVMRPHRAMSYRVDWVRSSRPWTIAAP